MASLENLYTSNMYYNALDSKQKLIVLSNHSLSLLITWAGNYTYEKFKALSFISSVRRTFIGQVESGSEIWQYDE